MSRRVYLLGVVIVLVAGTLAFTDWALIPPPGVTEANFRLVRRGMPRHQVNALFGRPADRVWDSGIGYAWVWEQGERKAIIFFHEDASRTPRVDDAIFQPPQPRPVPTITPGPLARLRVWLGW